MTSKKPTPLLHLAIATVICAAFAYAAFMGIEHYQKKQWSQAFSTETEKILTVLNGKFEINLHNLIGIRSLFNASTEVTPSEFQVFTKPILSEYKFIQALEWIPRVPDSDREIYENRIRNAGLPRFQFTEKLHQGDMTRARSRSEYFPVYYVEPMEGNEAAFGFDLSSNPSRLKSMRESRDSGEPIVTEKITLVQEKSSQYGALIFLPVFDGITVPETITERRSKLK
ncbi:MAG: CHASE domain-containing protein, partial [Nitrospinae bacterium]|nr:CHASE domain-containing protein [Nitrospinota bacterium]